MKDLKVSRNRLAASVALIMAGLTTAAPTLAQQQDSEEFELVEVRGIAASHKRNLNEKRFSDSITDAITAEDIGKLPDVTIADTLQRIPGVQIRRSAGEGSTVNVRGMPQVTTLLNGEQMLSAGSITSVQPDFSDIPAPLVSGISVHKSPTASMLAGGISGTLDLQTLRPFDLDSGATFTGAAELTRGSLSKENDHKLIAFGGYRGDDMGFLLSASYDTNNLANYRYGTILTSFEELDESFGNARDINGDGDTNDSLLSQRFHGMMDKEVERDRLGVNASFQAALSDNLEFVADLFYTDMDDANRQQGIMVDNARGSIWAYSDDFIARTGNDQGGDIFTVNQAELRARRVSSYSESLTNDRQSTNLNLELKYAGNGPFSGSLRYLRGDAERSHTENVAHSYLTSGAQHGLLRNDGSGAEPANPRGYGPDPVPVQFDRTGEYITLDYGPDFGSDISSYNLVSTYSENNFDEDATLDVLRGDGRYEFLGEHISDMQFGLRYGKRDVTRDTYILVAPFTTGDISADVMWKDSGASLGDTNGDGENSVAGGDLTLGNTNYFTDLPEGWAQRVDGFGPGTNDSFYTINPKVLDDPFAFQNAIYPGNKRLSLPSRSFRVEEVTQSAYLRFNFDGQLGSVPYKANVGGQYIRTELDIVQNQLGDERPCSLCTATEKVGEELISRSYSDFLPAANITFNLTDDFLIRAAYGKTMTNLDMSQLAGGISVGRSRAGDELAAELGVSPDLLVAINGRQNGNPYLEPWRATNYNLSAEWYFDGSSLLSLGLFKMDIESFIEQGTVQMGLPDIDGVVRRDVPVTTEINGEGGTIDGIELAYHQAFDFLPGIFSGFGTTMNFTYAPSDSANVDVYGGKLPIQDNSERSANAILWYDRDGIQFRIAANYRSDRLDSLGIDVGEGVLPIWADDTLYVDMSASYDLNDDISLYLQGSNITEEFEDIYAQWEDNVVTQNVYERRFTFGVRGHF
ncbi:TonB-dependent receptor [Lacimicrobium alkaliphilum]|uniref:TonB-dependent receptor n=1 Tax=Lacimicrobium alkaliphilum TaxID=1526571 RepID=A0A0U2Z3Z6_9ALTE|nr:TonB-dependent receptor [Lacimicrobium alkaliphilum]ALS97188.1 TonB-dependent receptor [Lacimicrobium alkaliphilum]